MLICKKLKINFLQVSLAHMQRSRLSVSLKVQCRMGYTWHTGHYIRCYSSRRPGSTSLSLREQSYPANVRTIFTVTHIEVSFVLVPSLLRSTAGRAIPALLPLALHCKSALLNQPFLFLSNSTCLSFLYTLHRLSPFSSPNAFHHLFYNLSLIISKKFN